MVNLIIPIYESRKTLPKALDSLVAQTKDMFIVTLVQDGDGLDYSDIVEEYKRRGLKLYLLKKENGGQGSARQYGVDKTVMCDYVMFMDADDLLYPRAIDMLYREAKMHDFDVLASSFIAEQNNAPGFFLDVKNTPVTWCFTAGTPILTEDGYRPIEELKIGDLVYTKDGSLQPIENTMSRLAENIVSTKVSGALSLKTTDNHKFFIYDENKELTLKPLNQIDGKDKISLFKLPKDRNIHIEPALAYIIGRYVGDGWKTGKKVKLKSGMKEYMNYFLCCSRKEKEYLIQKFKEGNFSFGEHNKANRTDCQEFTIYKKNSELIKYLEDCGRYAKDKHFPREFLKWDDESLRNLLKGYFEADGCVVKSENREKQNKILSVSKRLVYETSLILRTLGYCPTYGFKELDGTTQNIMGRSCKRNNEYTVYWRDNINLNKFVKQENDKCWTSNIKIKNEPPEKVYNITVANNHSYIAGEFIVSNCHGKIYKVAYLREKNIRFLDELILSEDCYFNLVAVNCAEKKGKIQECTYLWRDNRDSITRRDTPKEFFFKNNTYFMLSQIWGIKKICEISGKIDDELLGATLNILYNHMMIQYYYGHDDFSYVDELKSLKENQQVQNFLGKPESWFILNRIIRASQIIDNEIFFYKQRFIEWVLEYIQKDGKEGNDLYS